MPDNLSSDMIRCILIDDDPMIHQQLVDLVATTSDVELVGQAQHADQTLTLYSQHRPDIVLMDILLPEISGIQATENLLRIHPDARVLSLSSYEDERWVWDMLRAGCYGYILKGTLADELLPTIRTVHSGGKVLSAPIASLLTSPPTTSKDGHQDRFMLTDREIEILQQLATGKTNAEVAKALHITTATVRYHITSVTEKMEVTTRTEAVVVAVRQGIV